VAGSADCPVDGQVPLTVDSRQGKGPGCECELLDGASVWLIILKIVEETTPCCGNWFSFVYRVINCVKVAADFTDSLRWYVGKHLHCCFKNCTLRNFATSRVDVIDLRVSINNESKRVYL
jgi:hypothetical protein